MVHGQVRNRTTAPDDVLCVLLTNSDLLSDPMDITETEQQKTDCFSQ